MTVTEFLEAKRGEITDRLNELAPLVDEYRRLEAAASALAGVGAAPAAPSTTTTAPRRKKGPGRPRGSGKKAASPAVPSVAAAGAAVAETAPTGRKKVGRPPGKKVGRPAGKGKARGGRPKGSGGRAAQALTFVEGQPGITIPELAAKMGIKQNYLYRVLPGLEQEGRLEKKGRGWYPKG